MYNIMLQVISKSARMSPGDVLSSITNSETMDIEENSQMVNIMNYVI